jgi:hypothetical protein
MFLHILTNIHVNLFTCHARFIWITLQHMYRRTFCLSLIKWGVGSANTKEEPMSYLCGLYCHCSIIRWDSAVLLMLTDDLCCCPNVLSASASLPVFLDLYCHLKWWLLAWTANCTCQAYFITTHPHGLTTYIRSVAPIKRIHKLCLCILTLC